MTQPSDKYSRLEYRRLIAWPQRLQREAPLLEQILAHGPSRRVLDLGCGPGQHSRLLAERGYEVVGVDASAAMIAAAREEPVPRGVSFIEGDICRIDELVRGEFGGAICLGNTLPHIRESDALAGLFSGLRSVMAANAPLLIQVLNYERIFSRGERYLPLSFRSDGEEDIVFLRLMDLGDEGEVRFFPSTLRLAPGKDPPLEVKAAKEVHLRGWRITELEAVLAAAGFSDLRCLGDFAGGRFEPLESRDLLLIAR